MRQAMEVIIIIIVIVEISFNYHYKNIGRSLSVDIVSQSFTRWRSNDKNQFPLFLINYSKQDIRCRVLLYGGGRSTPLATFWDHLTISNPNLWRWIGECGHCALEYIAVLLMVNVAPALVKFATALQRRAEPCFCDYSTQRWTTHIHHWLLFIPSLAVGYRCPQMSFIALEKQWPSADGGHCNSPTANQFDANDIESTTQ